MYISTSAFLKQSECRCADHSMPIQPMSDRKTLYTTPPRTTTLAPHSASKRTKCEQLVVRLVGYCSSANVHMYVCMYSTYKSMQHAAVVALRLVDANLCNQ